jgi:peptidoglycan biosynthesis protein MviN/MurJ (putative lipid II flippase)
VATYTAIAAGLPLALVAGAIHPLIVVVLGDEWLPTTDLVLWASLGMIVAASINTTMVSYALAEGDASSPLRAAVAEAVIACAMAATLTMPLGETGVGIAVTTSMLAATAALAFGTHPQLRRSLTTVAKTSLIAAIAAGVALALGFSNDWTGLLLSLAVVAVSWLALEMAFSRSELMRLVHLARPLLRRGAAA